VSSDAFDPAHYTAEEILRDGRSIHVRAIRPDDRERLLRHFKELSADSRYHRFFGVKRSLTEADLTGFTQLDFINHVGLVATLLERGQERFIGDARYVRSADPARAEVAFAVIDEHQGRGIATLLLEHLGRIARAAGISEFEADVLGDNNRMLEVFARSGFRVKRASAAGVIHLAFPTAETEEFIAARQAREREAAAHSVASILRPRSVAIIGASQDRTKLGGAIFANLRESGFTGALYPVNHSAIEVQGVRSFASLDAIGQPIDLAVIAVPAAAVEQEIERCARAGVRGVIVITAGFGETGAAGREIENRIRDLARHSGMRLVGPNCMGVINTEPRVRLNATFSPVPPPEGNIGIFSQSGALGIMIFEHLRERHLGISSFVAVGNRADVSNNDLISYWVGDANTAVIALYLESVGNPRNFARTAHEAAMIKPIVAVKSARSAAGRRVASSHSAAMANRDVAVDALFAQAGVIRTDTIEALFDVVAVLATQPLPKGPRVGVVSNAGGPAVLFTDACDAQGLTLPVLQPTTMEQLVSRLRTKSTIANPVDLTASATPNDLEYALAVVGNDTNVDAVVAIYAPPMAAQSSEAAAAIARGAAQVPAEKPTLAVFQSAGRSANGLASGRGTIPAYAFPENPAIALGAAWRYAQWRSRPRGNVYVLGRFGHDTIRAVVERALAKAAGECAPSRKEIATILRAAGIEVAQPEDPSGTPDLPPNDTDTSMGILMFVGVAADPTFGPLITCGFGGPIAELTGDIAFRLHPVTDVDAAEMIATLKASKLLDGYQGKPPADRQALVSLLIRVSALVEAIPEIVELELAPVSVQKTGAVVLDARMQLEPLR
jgi:acyl-CoA synthetase (NDP forming)/GNAT superfamily N-acetyltransferase